MRRRFAEPRTIGGGWTALAAAPALPSWAVTLFWYILRALLVSTAFAVGALGFVVMPAVAVSAVHKLGGVSLGAVLRYVPMIGIELIPYLVSLGFLLAVVSTYGRLSADREWIALQMAGVHPLRTLAPGALLALVLGTATIWLMGTLSPQWKLEKDQFRADILVEGLRNLAPGRTEFDMGRFYLSARGRDGRAFTDVQIVVPDLDIEGEVENIVLVAERVDISFDERYMWLTLTNTRTVDSSRHYRGGSERVEGGTTSAVPLDLIFASKKRDATRAKYRTTAALMTALETEQLEPEKERDYVFAVHSRWALGATYVLFLLIGMPTGLWLRSGTQLTAFGAASGYAFAYYILSLQLGKSLAGDGIAPPAIAAWATTLGGLAIGVFMLWRTLRR